MKKIFKEIAEELGIPQSTVENVYNAYWQFIKETIEKLPLKKINTEEEFNKLQPNFCIPYIGKLHCSLEDWRKIKNLENYYNTVVKNESKHKEDKADV